MARGSDKAIIYIFFVLTYLVLISTSTMLFNLFRCTTFPLPTIDGGGSRSFLSKDMSVDCDGQRYKSFVFYGGFMLLVYPFGIPALYMAVLWRERATLRDAVAMEREITNGWPTLGHLKFLVQAYPSEHCFFEVFECGGAFFWPLRSVLSHPPLLPQPSSVSLSRMHVFTSFKRPDLLRTKQTTVLASPWPTL